MSGKSLNSKVRNLARGKQKVRHHRYKIFRLLNTSSDEKLGDIGDYLLDSMMALRNEDLNVAFPLQEKDLEILERLSHVEGKVIEQNLLELAVEYFTRNKLYVHRLAKAEGEITAKLIDNDGKVKGSAFQSIDNQDRQSLLAFKLYASLHSTNQQEITRIERDVIRYLLLGDIKYNIPLAFKSYLSLVSHPYDGLEAIISHFEFVLSKGNSLTEQQKKALKKLYSDFPSERLKSVLSLSETNVVKRVTNVDALPVLKDLDIPPIVESFLQQYILRPVSGTSSNASTGYNLLDAFNRIRLNRYPEVIDFNDCVLFARQYNFLKIGKLLNLFLTGLYMINREDEVSEKRNILRQISFFGGVTDFTSTSPRYNEAVTQGLITCSQPITASTDLNAINRWWIKDFHNGQYQFKIKADFKSWFKECRKIFPLFCNSQFLSGVDWSWVDEIKSVARIKPFLGNPDAIYVLLLRQIEEGLPDSATIRLAFSPFLKPDDQTSDFVSKLDEVYSVDAIAFVVSYLSPTMILSMGLESSYTAALSARVESLEVLVDKYGLNDEVLTEGQLTREVRSLVSYLVFSAIGDEQFEMPWSSFNDIAEAKSQDIYDTHKRFTEDDALQKILGESRTKKSKLFANKRIHEYSFPNSKWSSVDVIVSIIDTFLSHPAYGIESILAVRIRHDNLRTEFSMAIEDAAKLTIAGITSQTFSRISSKVQSGIFDTLQIWEDSYMHTPRGSVDGIFEFVPSQVEMIQLIAAMDTKSELKSVVINVSEWLKIRLGENLETARKLVDENLRESLKNTIAATKQSMLKAPYSNQANIEKVTDVLSTVIDAKCSEILPWFRAPPTERIKEITYSQMRYAIERRFYRDVDTGKIKLSFRSDLMGEERIARENIKSIFSIWSELVLNSKKYSGLNTTRMRIKEHSHSGLAGFLFSSHCDKCSKKTYSTYNGSPVTAEKAMLLSGKSGLKKVASLSATLVDQDCKIHVFRRRYSFHVFVPHKGA